MEITGRETASEVREMIRVLDHAEGTGEISHDDAWWIMFGWLQWSGACIQAVEDEEMTKWCGRHRDPIFRATRR